MVLGDSVDDIMTPPDVNHGRQPLRSQNSYQYSTISRLPFDRESSTIDSTYSFILNLSEHSTGLALKATPRQLRLLANLLKNHQYVQSQMRECTLSIMYPHTHHRVMCKCSCFSYAHSGCAGHVQCYPHMLAAAGIDIESGWSEWIQ